MTNSPQIYNVYGTETKHGSGHNLLTVRYHKAALNKHAPHYSTSIFLNSTCLSPNKIKYFFALFRVAYALSKSFRHYSVNYLYFLLQKVLLQDFVTEH